MEGNLKAWQCQNDKHLSAGKTTAPREEEKASRSMVYYRISLFLGKLTYHPFTEREMNTAQTVEGKSFLQNTLRSWRTCIVFFRWPDEKAYSISAFRNVMNLGLYRFPIFAIYRWYSRYVLGAEYTRTYANAYVYFSQASYELDCSPLSFTSCAPNDEDPTLAYQQLETLIIFFS